MTRLRSNSILRFALRQNRTHNSDAYIIVIDLAASLAAAISLLEKGGKAAKKAAPSDKMFDQMLRDYRKSLDRARQALAGDDHD